MVRAMTAQRPSLSTDIKSKSKRGGKRAGAGRPKNTPNRATPEQKQSIEELARSYAPDCLAVLHKIATRGTSEASQVAAANSLIERGYGKARQSVEHTGEGGGAVIHRVELVAVYPE